MIKETKIDKVFSIWIRNRDGRCLRCGKKENLQCAHIYSRIARSVRYEPLNAITLCYGCHIGWSHKYPIEFTEFIKKYLGTRKYNLLKEKYHTLKPGGFSEQEKQEIINKYSLTVDK